MKYLTLTILLIAMIASLISCGGNPPLSPIDPAVTTDAQSVKGPEVPLFDGIFAVGRGESDAGDFRPDYPVSASLLESGLRRAEKTVNETELAGAIMKFGKDGAEFTYSETRCDYADAAQTKVGGFYSIYDTYVQGAKTLEKLRGSDLVTMYYAPSESGKENHSDLIARAEMEKAAAACMRDLLAVTLSDAYVCAGTQNDATNRQVISYYREIHGYRTDDSISLWFNKDLSLSGINARRLGSFETAASKLTKADLDEASAMLTALVAASSLPAGYELHEPMLTTNNEGKVFLEAAVSYTTPEGLSCMDTVYISVG